MSTIRQLMEQVQPQLEEIIKNPGDNPNAHTMKLLVEKISEHDETAYLFEHPRTQITRCVMAMKIDVSNMEDAENAASFLFSGFKLMVSLITYLSGRVDTDTLLDACRQLEIRG